MSTVQFAIILALHCASIGMAIHASRQRAAQLHLTRKRIKLASKKGKK